MHSVAAYCIWYVLLPSSLISYLFKILIMQGLGLNLKIVHICKLLIHLNHMPYIKMGIAQFINPPRSPLNIKHKVKVKLNSSLINFCLEIIS